MRLLLVVGETASGGDGGGGGVLRRNNAPDDNMIGVRREGNEGGLAQGGELELATGVPLW